MSTPRRLAIQSLRRLDSWRLVSAVKSDFLLQGVGGIRLSHVVTSVYGRFCSLIPGLGVKLSNDHPCRAHCSLRGRGEPSA